MIFTRYSINLRMALVQDLAHKQRKRLEDEAAEKERLAEKEMKTVSVSCNLTSC